jgi:hypothetical protein
MGGCAFVLPVYPGRTGTWLLLNTFSPMRRRRGHSSEGRCAEHLRELSVGLCGNGEHSGCAGRKVLARGHSGRSVGLMCTSADFV